MANSHASERDMRFTLTDQERESVRRLKAACDEENVKFKSLFELVKYVLVSHSSVSDKDKNAGSKRLKIALHRLKKMRAWEAKYGLDNMIEDPLAAMEKVHEATPDYYVNDYVRDREGGRVIVGHAPVKSAWIHASRENLALWFAQEVVRNDLAAADLEEARRGIAILVRQGEKGFCIKAATKYIRDFLRCKDMVQPMHSHRIKRVYVQSSPFATKFVNIVKKFLPNKIASRVVVVSTIDELDSIVERAESPKSVRDWYTERNKVYAETLEKLQI